MNAIMTDEARTRSAKNVAIVVYALQALSFFFGMTYLAAVIVNYVRRSDVSGSWLESHFRWQIRTFWYSLLGWLVGVILLEVLVGWVIISATAVWVLYRVIKGWLYLNEGKPMYLPTGGGNGPLANVNR